MEQLPRKPSARNFDTTLGLVSTKQNLNLHSQKSCDQRSWHQSLPSTSKSAVTQQAGLQRSHFSFLTLRGRLEPKVRGQVTAMLDAFSTATIRRTTAPQRTWHILDALFPQLLHLAAFHTRRFSSMRPKTHKLLWLNQNYMVTKQFSITSRDECNHATLMTPCKHENSRKMAQHKLKHFLLSLACWKHCKTS